MTTNTAEIDAYIDAAAKLMEITVEQEWLPTIRAHLEVTLAQARSVQAFQLPDDAEPAFAFEA